ncbi:MAG: hypothetical protein WDN04_21480 [Rhodospirillales bacterium]
MGAVVLKAGARLKSAVCETQIMVLRVPPVALEIGCGGHPMMALAETPAAGLVLNAAFAGPTLTGKRYVDADETMEFLCTKGGAGALSVNGVGLAVKQAKALPSSD